jgi:hypothetical protein
MPLDYLWSEAAIRDGDALLLRRLLMQLRRAYGHAALPVFGSVPTGVHR